MPLKVNENARDENDDESKEKKVARSDVCVAEIGAVHDHDR